MRFVTLSLLAALAAGPALARTPSKPAAKSSSGHKASGRSASKAKPASRSKSSSKKGHAASAKKKDARGHAKLARSDRSDRAGRGNVDKRSTKSGDKRADSASARLPEGPLHEAGDGPEPPAEPRLDALRDRLTSLLRERPLSRSRIGVEVVSARDGGVLFRHNADKLFNPASNTKILATAAALSQLGPDHRYRTAVYGAAPDDDGVVHGDVELRGSGDPSLMTADLAELARALAGRGVTRIEGDVLADGRFRDPQNPDRRVGEQAIILNRNTYTIRVRPTSVGHAPDIDVQPETDYFTVRNAAKTVAKKRTRLRVDVSREGERLVVIVKGRVSDRGEAVVRRRIGEAATYAAAVLRRALLDFGIEVTGGVRVGGVEGKAPALAEHVSPPLSVICRVSNKDSNNFVADTIFKTAGGERYGNPPSLSKGQKLVADMMGPLGFGAGTYRVENGSGLSYANRISPSTLTSLLRHLYLDLSIAPEFVSSLAIGGVDGTIRNRFRGTAVRGLVRAKTGTLTNVSALSGYVGDTGDVLIFSILVEGFGRSRSRLQAVRHAQVRLVDAMLAYLHAGEPRRGAPPTVVEPTEGDPEIDYEDDGDVTGGQ